MNALAVVTLPDPYIKVYDNNDDVKMVTALEEGVDVPCGGITFPCLPVFFLIPGSLIIEPIDNFLPSIHDINSCFHLGGRVNSVQEYPCGRGK